MPYADKSMPLILTCLPPSMSLMTGIAKIYVDLEFVGLQLLVDDKAWE